MAQLSLYHRTVLEDRVSLFAEQIDGDMDKHILDNLRLKIQGKTIDYGIVLKINRLIDYGYGMIDKANFMGTTVFPVKYECFVCSPTKNLEIVCVLENMIKGYLVAKNGPLIITVNMININTQIFESTGNTVNILKTKKPIEIGQYLKVSIINIVSNLGEKNMMTVCKLLNLASKEEIESFKKDQQMIANIDENEDAEFI